MSLYKRGNVWWTRIIWSGQTIQQSTRCKSKRDALNVEAAMRTRLAKGEVDIHDFTATPTLAAFEKRFLGYLPSHVSARTVGFYTESWAPLVKFPPLAKARLQHITVALIDRFTEHRLAQGVMPQTVNGSLRTLRRALHLAADWNLIRKSPKVKVLPGERQREFIISEDILAKFLGRCSPGMKRLLPFLIDTGLRITECCNLTWETVSLEPKEGAARGWVYVAKGKSKYAQRYVPLTARAADVLRECRTVSKKSCPWPFTAFDGRRKMARHWPTQQFGAMRDVLELPWDCVLHSCRHTFCTRLGESGCDAFTIQKLAGHSSIVISQRYVHPTPARLERAIDMLEASTISSTASQSESVSG